MQRIDPYTRLQNQIRRNFETQIEIVQELQQEQEMVSSDSEDETLFVGTNVKLFHEDKYIGLPKSLLELDNLVDLITYDQFTQLFDTVEQEALYKHLPHGLTKQDQKELMKQLLEGGVFHFGNPLNIFLRQCQSGFFTKNRQQCDRMDYEIAIIRQQEYETKVSSYFRKPNYKEKIKQRLRQSYIRDFSPCSPISGQSCEKRIRLDSEDDSISTISSQSFSAPQYIHQTTTQAPLPLQFQTSSQSLFATTPITALPQYTSTSLLTNQMTLAYLQARKCFKKPGGGTSGGPTNPHNTSKLKLESTVPTGQSDRQWLENYWKQETDRYKNPLVAYAFTCIDGSKACVAPAAKKLLSGMSSKPRQHELLKNERPPYVTILSLVRDAAARLPKGYGTRADIMNLVKDSQFINENLPDEKMSSIISGALDRLHQSSDPCVKYDQEKKIWIYLHHDRDHTYPDWQVSAPQQVSAKPKKKETK